MKTGIPTNGSMVKNHISLRTEFGFCNTENFVPIVVPGLSSSSSASSSTSRTLMKQESHSSSSSSSSPSSPTVGDLSVREREDVTNSDISPVPVSEFIDDSSGRPDEDQANEIQKPNKKETPIERGNRVMFLSFRNGCKNSGKIWWMMKFHYREALTPGSSHEASFGPIAKRREDLGKHNFHTHFPKDRNCEICERTEITTAPCRRSYSGVVKQNFTRNPEKLAKVLGTREETKSHLH